MTGIILFGDSVFFGTGATNRNNGCGRILRALGVNVLIKGRNGETTREGLKRLEADVLKKNGYSHAILLFGNNDCKLIGVNKALIDLKEYRDNLSEMIHRIKLSGKIPLISNLQPIDSEGFYKAYPEIKKFIAMKDTPYQWHKKYSDICAEIAKSERIQLLNVRSRLEERKEEVLASDGLHPNDLGHKIIAETIFKTLI